MPNLFTAIHIYWSFAVNIHVVGRTLVTGVFRYI